MTTGQRGYFSPQKKILYETLAECVFLSSWFSCIFTGIENTDKMAQLNQLFIRHALQLLFHDIFGMDCFRISRVVSVQSKMLKNALRKCYQKIMQFLNNSSWVQHLDKQDS